MEQADTPAGLLEWPSLHRHGQVLAERERTEFPPTAGGRNTREKRQGAQQQGLDSSTKILIFNNFSVLQFKLGRWNVSNFLKIYF